MIEQKKDWLLKSLKRFQIFSSFLLIGIPTRGVYLSQLFAKYLEEISGQPIENGCFDPTFHRDDIARVGNRIAQITNLTF